MLAAARRDHPSTDIVIKSHTETISGYRRGYFSAADETSAIQFLTAQISPWHLFDGAVAIYTFSSHMSFEAILTGHTRHVFGQPFYAEWGLTKDHVLLTARTRRLSREQLFVATMIQYLIW